MWRHRLICATLKAIEDNVSAVQDVPLVTMGVVADRGRGVVCAGLGQFHGGRVTPAGAAGRAGAIAALAVIAAFSG